MAQTVPLILCGRTAAIASVVVDALRPEYEVIHVILSPSAGARDIPFLLENGILPPRDESTAEADRLGTRGFARAPAAIVTGAGYDDAAFAALREASKGTTNVTWLRPDLEKNKTAPPLGPAYGEALVKRLKERLGELKEDGKLQKDGVYHY